MFFFLIYFLNNSLRCNTQSEGPLWFTPDLFLLFFTLHHRGQSSVAFPCIVIALHVLLFTVKRFQQTKHRNKSVFNACFLQLSLSVQFPSVAKKRMSLCTLGGSKCQEVRFLCFSRALPLSPTSAQSAAVSFPAKHNTSKKDLSCHAKISVSTTAPLSASCCSSG